MLDTRFSKKAALLTAIMLTGAVGGLRRAGATKPKTKPGSKPETKPKLPFLSEDDRKTPRLPRTLGAARKLFARGFYEKALETFEYVTKRGSHAEGLVGQARVLMRTGRYSEALAKLSRARRLSRVAAEADTLIARLHYRTGHYARARKLLEKVIQRDRMNLEARITLGRLLKGTGKLVAAKPRFKDFFTDLSNGYLKEGNARHMMYVGMAARGMSSWQEASSAFEAAAKLDPKLVRNWLEWADLALHKYRVDWADENYKKVLAIDPNHPEALAGLAWVEWYAPRSDHHKGKKLAKRALAINPKCIKAMLYLVSLEIFDAKYPKATKIVDRALKVNSSHLHALSLKATIYFLTEKHADFARLKKKALKINPKDGDFFVQAAKFVSRHHRYADAAKLDKMALQVDPKDADALADLGINQLRIGEYGMGWFNLNEAYRLDQFNHKTANLLTLRDEIKKRFKWIEQGYIKLLVPKDEVELLSRYVPRMLNRTISTYLKKYSYKPHIPVFLELYDKAQDFQARTFGEPAETGIMGVCFGKVVTSMSPSLGRTNWAYVLWHELAHVIHTQLTGGKVPRWFTEGLAEYETVVARPEWKREHSRNLHRMKVTGSLAPIVDLDMRFTRSRNMMGVVLAYYQSTLAVEHMHKRWGWDKLVEALHVYAKGHQTEHVLETVFDIEPAAFDKAFSAFLDERLSHYEGQFDPLAFTVMDPKELEKRAKKAKDAISSKQPSARSKQREDARIVAWLSMLHAIRGKKKEAKAALETAKKLAKNVNHPHVRFAQAFLYRLSGEHEKEKAALQKLVADGHDSYEGRLRLAKLAARSKSYPKVISHLKAATKLDPEASQPLVELAFLYKKLKKKKEVADVITRLAFIKQTSASIVYTAIVRNSRLKRWDRVRKLGPLGIHNQPFNSTIHEKYAWALRAAGKHKEALFEFQSALLCKPRNAEYIHVGIARSYLAMGQTKKALVHVNRALDVSSNFRPAVELLRKLRPL